MQRFQKLRDSAYKSALGSTYLEQGRYAEAIASTGAEAEARRPEDAGGDARREAGRHGRGAPAAGERPVPPRVPRSCSPTSTATACSTRWSRPEASLRVLHGTGERLEDVTAKAGLGGAAAVAAVAGDYDNDGHAPTCWS